MVFFSFLSHFLLFWLLVCSVLFMHRPVGISFLLIKNQKKGKGLFNELHACTYICINNEWILLDRRETLSTQLVHQKKSVIDYRYRCTKILSTTVSFSFTICHYSWIIWILDNTYCIFLFFLTLPLYTSGLLGLCPFCAFSMNLLLI